MNKSIKKIIHKYERGQVIILVAFSLVGIVAMVGLVSDTGLLLIQYGNLKRGVDAAAIGAAQQYSLPSADLTPQAFTDAATNFLNLNQTQGVTNVSVHSCLAADLAPPALCNTDQSHPEDNRKLVEVTASSVVKFYFLSVVGIRSTTLTANSVGEAATLDIVMVIDTSASMAYETRPNADPFNYDHYSAGLISENPEDCNASTTAPCQPLNAVKLAALAFIDTLSFGYDRVGIVALTGQQTDGTALRHPVQVLALSTDKTTVANAINGLKVFQPHRCDDSLTDSSPIFNPPNDPGVCIYFVDGQFNTVLCQSYKLQSSSGTYNYAPCPSSNVGGALRIAAATLSGADRRLDSLWVTLMLLTSGATSTDTPANYPDTTYADGIPAGFPYGYCPANENYPSAATDVNGNGVYDDYKFCQDGRPSVRHSFSDTSSFTYNGSTQTISIYDPDDYARDRADNLANLLSGTGVTIYTIGLGAEVQNKSKTASGEPLSMTESLLTYIATQAGRSTVAHGQYFYTPNVGQLTLIFKKIADNIATKISQ